MKKKKTKILVPLIFILIFLIVLLSTLRKFSLAQNTNISSDIYIIENNIITNISPKTNIELYKKYFELENCYIKITNELDQEINSGYIYTGSKTVVYNNENTVINTYTNIITGDITKDGIITENDIESLAEYLITNNNLNEYELKAIDINKDSIIKINDLTLIEQLMNSEYTNLEFNKEELTIMTNEQERIIPTITPNIILEQNLVWTSSDENVSTVDESGKITGIEEGETTITAITKDGKKSKTIKVIVDNTPILEKQSINLHSGGDVKEVSIKAVDYNDLTCTSDNTDVATCKIQDKKLILTPINDGTTKVTVSSPRYGNTQINVATLFTSFTVFPKAWCITPRTSAGGGTISGFNFGTITVKSISDTEIVKNGYIFNIGGRKTFGIETNFKTGDAQIVFTESNGHNNVTFTAKVYILKLETTFGTTTIGNNLIIRITNENTGELSCTSSNEENATCTIENNNLIINPIKEGTVSITVNGEKCGNETYNLTIQNEEVAP